MAAAVKAITLRATYESDLSGFKQDAASIRSFRKQLEKTPIKVAVRLDLGGIRADAQRAAAEYKKALGAAMARIPAGGTVSKGGIIVPAGAARELEQIAGTSRGVFKQVTNDAGKVLQTFEQLEAGVQRVVNVGKKGRTTRIIDTRPLEQFQQKLAEIERKYAQPIGSARGSKGDVAGILRQKQQEIAAALNDPKLTAAIKDTPLYQRADKSLDRLSERINNLEGTQTGRSARQFRNTRIDSLKESLLDIEKTTAAAIGAAKGNRGDVAAVLADKRRRIDEELAKFTDIADSNTARSARKSLATLDKQIAQALPGQQRRSAAEAKKDFDRRTNRYIERQDDRVNRELEKKAKEQMSLANRIPDQIGRERELNRIMDERIRILRAQADQYRRLAEVAKSRGQDDASNRYLNAARRMEGSARQVGLDRTRGETERLNQASEQALKRRLDQLTNLEKTQRQIADNERKAARGEKNETLRNNRLQQIQSRRDAERAENLRDIRGVEAEASRRGNRGIADRAYNTGNTITRQGVAEMNALAAATNKSGHAFNFHTSSLLKNAATFTRWYAPAQLVMGAFAAITRGANEAVAAQRTFKVLDAVYRGSAEESARLADQTLMLAAANGRSTQEAAESAVAWARLGFTRSQALVAIETSLRAANVAEISAAEATAYLTANYKAFGQTIADIPATLDFINSLSNKNAAAPKQIFEGLSRSAAIAGAAGLSFERLTAIITSMIEVTQRPGAEQGNAVKTILTRLNRPTTIKKLKENFNIDSTDSSGGLRPMEERLQELALLYPKMSSAMQPYLKDIVAGANQGNRFVIMLESWTDGLIAQANAGVDANSAMRENAGIMDSVSAKLARLETTWTRFFHTIGEAGAFDVAAQGLAGMAAGVDDLSSAIAGMADFAGIDSKTLQAAKDRMTFNAGRSLASPARYLYLTTKDIVQGNFAKPPGEEADPTSQLSATRLGRLAQRTVEARNRVGSFDAGEKALQVMAAQFSDKSVDAKKIQTQFDELAPLLAELPGGQANVARARNEIRPLLEREDRSAGAQALSKLSTTLDDAGKKEFTTSEEERKAAVTETEQVIAASIRKREKLEKQQLDVSKMSQEKQDDLTLSIYKTDQALKEQQEILKGLRKEIEKTVDDPLQGLQYKLDDYLADLSLVGKAFGDLLSTIGSTGFAGLDTKLKLGGARMEGDLLQRDIDATRYDNRLESMLGVSPEKQAQMDKTVEFMEARLTEIREATAEAEREIELQRQTAALQTAFTESRRSTASGFGRYEIGVSEGGRMANRTGGILNELDRDVANPDLGAGDALNDFREMGGIVERMTQAREGLLTMEDRMNRVVAERANLETSITEENRKQTEEASKRLALASREDQLRAAAAAAVLRSRGRTQFSLEEFQFMSQESRGAISSLMPNAVKGLDDTEKNQNESRRKLDAEYTGLAVTLKMLKDRFDTLLPKAEEKAGGIVNGADGLGIRPRKGTEILNKDKNEVRMNLNTGPISINLDLSTHLRTLEHLLQTRFDARLEAFAQDMRRFLTQGRDPNTAPAMGAW